VQVFALMRLGNKLWLPTGPEALKGTEFLLSDGKEEHILRFMVRIGCSVLCGCAVVACGVGCLWQQKQHCTVD